MMRLNKLRNMQPITILDKDYLTWVQTLCERYRTSQIKAAVKVNQEMLHYYWLLGKKFTKEVMRISMVRHFMRHSAGI